MRALDSGFAVLPLLLFQGSALAAAGAAGPDPVVPLSPEYALLRNVALGLGAIGFLVAAGSMALNRDLPEAYLHWRKVLLLCTAVFLIAALDRTVARGVIVALGYSEGTVPLWWR